MCGEHTNLVALSRDSISTLVYHIWIAVTNGSQAYSYTSRSPGRHPMSSSPRPGADDEELREAKDCTEEAVAEWA
jgi:hypothetical protein